jgi:CelD/BcsL family acetyltransferase involved in cellulose biosynthesis
VPIESSQDPVLPRTLRSVAEVERFRPSLERARWTRLDPEPDYYLTVLRSRPEVIGPYVLHLPGGPDEEVVLMGRSEVVRLPAAVGYAAYAPTVRAITVVHGGVAGADATRAASELLDTLRAALAAGEADVAILPSLRTGSALLEAAQRVPFAQRDHLRTRTTHWTLRLPDSYEEFVKARSKRTRDNIKQYRNRLMRKHGDEVSVTLFNRPEEADRLFRDTETIAAKTYQRGLGVAFADTPEQRALVELGLERGWFRMYLLSIGGEPAAFWPGSAYNRTFFTGTPGYDPAYADLRLGTYLLLHVIEELCADDAVDVVDYGFGESDYKQRFGNESWEEEDVLIFAPTFRGIRINATRTAVVGAARLARAAATRTGLAPRLKRRWRRRLAARGPASPVG